MTKAELIILLLTALGLWLLVQFSGLKFWHAVVVFAAGFYLATTIAGAQVHTWAACSRRSGTRPGRGTEGRNTRP